MLTTFKTGTGRIGVPVSELHALYRATGRIVTTIENKVGLALGDIARLEEKLAELETRPMMEGREWWKDNKYLYICHPTTASGQRPRTYIGADSAAIEQAREQIKRRREYDHIEERLSGKVRAFNQFYRELQQLNNDITRLTK